jgi:outer membrane receptor protein involved in Fe transport
MKTSPTFKLQPLAAAAVIATLGLGLQAPAAAQATAAAPASSAASAASDVQTVTVTAQGRRENIQKVPYNISAISGDEIAARQITSQTDLLRGVTGASVVDRGARNGGVISGITLRGLNVNSSALGDYQLSAAPTVSTYVNDTPIFANFLLKDLDRVEVLRGPQGTLYGSGSMGGTVRYITRRPELKTFSGEVEGSFSKTEGSSGFNKAADAIVNVPLGDSVALRVLAGKVDNAGVIDYPNVYRLDATGTPVAPSGISSTDASYRDVKDADTTRINYARASLLLKPSDAWSALLTYQTQNDHIGARTQPTRGDNGAGVPYGKYENGSVQLEPSQRDVNLGSLELEFDLGFATLSSGTSHYDQSGHSISENTGFYAKNNWLANYYYNYPRPMAEADRSYSDKAWVQEVRLASRTGGTVDYVGGLFYMDQDLGATQYSYLRGLKAWADVNMPATRVTTDNDFLFDRSQAYKEKALFGEITYHVSPALRVTGGLRTFWTDSTNNTALASGVYSPVPIHTSFAQNDSGTLWKGNVAYDLSPQAMLFATASEGYRRGGANVVPLTGTFAESPAFQTFKPDSTKNYEIGVKGTSSGGVRYSATLFDIDWKNIQLDTATPNWGFYAAQNGGRARSDGLELDASGHFSSAWGYSVGYAYVDAKLTQDVGRADDPTITIAHSGARLPGSAKHTVNASLDHTQSLGNLFWTNRVSATWQSSTENSISTSPLFAQKWNGFSLWNLSSTLADDRWSATFFVKNVFNNAGETGGLLKAYMGTDPSQNYFGNGSKVFIAQPRTIGLSATYSF